MITGKQLRDAFISGANSISNSRAAVDELNVFPVPDGDTGSNMSMTINNAVPELQKLPDNCTVEAVANTAASGLLRGARGNSGVILSLLFRGFSRAMSGKTEADSTDLAFALEKGVGYAYKAVMKPAEGTILTVARVSAQSAKESADKMDTTELWELVVKTANETLLTTPELLPVLKKAGVVDSGGKGLCVIFEGILETFRTGKIVESKETAPTAATARTGVYAEGLDPDLANAYCTEFIVVKNDQANYEKLRAFLESMGDSVVCVDDAEIIKCHVHTAEPDRALAEALHHGRLSKIKIENMAEQYEARQSEAAKEEGFPYVAPGEDEEYAFVAVGAGEGVQQLFRELGATRVVSGGQTMNPSTDDIINAVQSLSAKNIFILANNKNIIMSAQQATTMCDRPATVVPTRSIPEGISALMAFDETVSASENLENMKQAFSAVTTAEVTFASRDSEFDGQKIKENDILGLVGGKLAFTAHNAETAAVRAITDLATPDKSYVTIIYGEGIDEKDAIKVKKAAAAKINKSIEITLVNGGMPVYYYCISIE